MHHLFALNGNMNKPDVLGVKGILDAYHSAINAVALWGPTNFAPTVQAAIQSSRQADAAARAAGMPYGQYTVLLIITDGEITDMNETIAALREASRSPISVVIVGVGNADFTKMELLDGDPPQGIGGVRDCVQFVELQKVTGNPQRVCEETLKEIPTQVKEVKIKIEIFFFFSCIIFPTWFVVLCWQTTILFPNLFSFIFFLLIIISI